MNIPKTSLAAVFHAPREPFELREVEIPTLTPGVILVEISMCTICGSDLHTYYGRRDAPVPSVLGHEMVGRLIWPDNVIDGVGKRVRRGERLVWSLASSCGHCEFCSFGLPQKCKVLQKYGHHAMTAGWPLSGGLAEYCMLVPGTFFLGIPDALPDALAAPATCATATVSAAISRAGELVGKTVLVIGAGMLGSTACAMLDSSGVKRILVADSNLDRVHTATAFGAKYALDAGLDAVNFVDAVRECSEGYGADVVIELAGANDAVRKALSSTRIGGTCLLVGSVFPQDPLPVFVEDIVRRVLNIRGIYNYSPQDLVKAIEFLTTQASRYPFQTLVSGDFTLSEVKEAFEAANMEDAPYRVAVHPTNGRS